MPWPEWLFDLKAGRIFAGQHALDDRSRPSRATNRWTQFLLALGIGWNFRTTRQRGALLSAWVKAGVLAPLTGAADFSSETSAVATTGQCRLAERADYRRYSSCPRTSSGEARGMATRASGSGSRAPGVQQCAGSGDGSPGICLRCLRKALEYWEGPGDPERRGRPLPLDQRPRVIPRRRVVSLGRRLLPWPRSAASRAQLRVVSSRHLRLNDRHRVSTYDLQYGPHLLGEAIPACTKSVTNMLSPGSPRQHCQGDRY